MHFQHRKHCSGGTRIGLALNRHHCCDFDAPGVMINKFWGGYLSSRALAMSEWRDVVWCMFASSECDGRSQNWSVVDDRRLEKVCRTKSKS